MITEHLSVLSELYGEEFEATAKMLRTLANIKRHLGTPAWVEPVRATLAAKSLEVRANVLAEGAKLRETLLRFRSEHSWKRPGQALEAHDFPEMVWARPMLEDEGCDIDELPMGFEASTEDWCVLAHLLRERVTAMQVFARSKDPGAAFEDVMDDSLARKRARSPPAAAKRAHFDPEVAAGLRTVTEEQSQQALNGTLTPESVPKPAGDGAPHSVIPQHAGGALSGLDLQVYPGQNLDAQEKKLVLGEDGRSLQWETSSKRTRCSTLPKLERGFCFVMRKVQSDRQHRLMVFFKEWFQLRALEYGVAQVIKLYEYLILQMVEDPSVTFERRCYSQSFEDYVWEQRLQPAGSGQPWREDWSPREEGGGSGENDPGTPASPNAPRDASGPGVPRLPMRRVVGPGASPPVVAGRRRRAPAGAPALEPVYGESYEPEIEEEDDVRPVASGFELTPVDPSDGDYIEIGRGVATQGGPEPTWTATMSTFAVASAPVPETEPGKWSVLEGASRRLRRSRGVMRDGARAAAHPSGGHGDGRGGLGVSARR
ncbi:hypothetical protein CYMTET_12939 [Cymbomonas tetramitiformis]|uniref:Uncharacterized protein n=1 Tax=Cymbomonas tetramitiformis TaxID=36881 RepID=A0AAE0GJG3_9CHLO|nr:hypothetical protein CYMTET_12939 [Cymbomonas tetramitiformis]